MAQKTPNYNLNKPGYEDFGDVDMLNENFEKIDKVLAATDPTKITAKAEPADGDGVMIADSADGGKAKRLLWLNVKAALGKLFVPLARKINGKTLAEDVTLTGENIAVSAADPTSIYRAVKYRVNPNLLDNWYFGESVNQNGGMMVPSDTQIYADSTLTDTSPGVTTAWRQVEYVNSTYCIYRGSDGSSLYYVKTSDAIPGYCAAGYTVDRWFLEHPYNLKIDATGLHFTPSNSDSYTNLIQKIPFEKWTTLNGKTITVSVLTSDGKLLYESGTWTPESGPVVRFDNFEFSSAAFVNAQSYQLGRLYVYAGKSADVLAVKVELGDTQTLAHQENGVWILNEIPDFREQLRRCQWFREKKTVRVIGINTKSLYFCENFSPKRAYPAITLSVNDYSNLKEVVNSVWSIDDNSASGILGDLTNADKQAHYYGTMTISADL